MTRPQKRGLVITRMYDESVVLFTKDGPVRITVDRPRRSSDTRLRFEAPQTIKIFREEIVERSDDLPSVGEIP